MPTEHPAPFCGTEDLRLEPNHLEIPDAVNLERWVDQAGSEMEAKLGFTYRVPLRVHPDAKDGSGAPLADLQPHELNLLRDINANLATGRLLMTIQSSGDPESVHRYAMTLINDALDILYKLSNLVIPLSAERIILPGFEEESRSPKVANRDAYSLVEAFEDRFMDPAAFAPHVLRSPLKPGGG